VTVPTNPSGLREVVRARYAAAAAGECSRSDADSCCSNNVITDEQREWFGQSQYTDADRESLPDSAVLASLGCGNPSAVAELREGETVLDLGSGGGIDVLLSARRVGSTGLAYGLDMTDEMLDLARQNQTKAGVTNVQWLRGHIEDIPLPRESVDVIISNCVINLAADKAQVLREAARVLKPGGRFAISDVIADPNMDDATRADMAAFTGCIAGALTREQFTHALQDAGLTDVSITKTHRVHAAAGSAIVRATKPASSCCPPTEQVTCCEPAAKASCCAADATAAGGCACR
jgi:arsenite methyltransferase